MLNVCKNCGGRIQFEPKVKGNQCTSCGSVFNINYDPNFVKNTFENDIKDNYFEVLDKNPSYKCSACGANIVVGDKELQAQCPYCSSTSLVKSKMKGMLKIDSICPFNISKSDMFKMLKDQIKRTFFANKKLFRNMTERDLKGVYVNSFVYDFDTESVYNGRFCKRKKNKDNVWETIYVSRFGNLDKNYRNITIEASSHLNQDEFKQINNYDYSQAVKFQEDFMCGYTLEYQDKVFDACLDMAQGMVKKDLQNEILNKENCDWIDEIDIKTIYPYKAYNYCLLPVYFIDILHKKTTKRVFINGQNGKVGNLPKNKGKVFGVVFGVFAGIALIVLLVLKVLGIF